MILLSSRLMKCHLLHVRLADTKPHHFTPIYWPAWIKTSKTNGFLAIVKHLLFFRAEVSGFPNVHRFSYSTVISRSLGNSPCDVSPYGCRRWHANRKWQWGWRYCASEFIWSDQKHDYALLAHNKPQLSGLENSFICINSVAVWQ